MYTVCSISRWNLFWLVISPNAWMAGQLGLCERLPWLTSIMSGLHNRGPVAGLASETGVLHESAVHVRKTVDPVARAYDSPILLSQFANSASSNPNSCCHELVYSYTSVIFNTTLAMDRGLESSKIRLPRVAWELWLGWISFQKISPIVRHVVWFLRHIL